MKTKQPVFLDEEILLEIKPYLQEANLSLEEYLNSQLKKLVLEKKRETGATKKPKQKFADFVGGLNGLDPKSLQEIDEAMLGFRKNFSLNSKTALDKKQKNQEKYQSFLNKLDLDEIDQESLDEAIKAGQDFRKNFKLIRD